MDTLLRVDGKWMTLNDWLDVWETEYFHDSINDEYEQSE